jgi:hypothetical protein
LLIGCASVADAQKLRVVPDAASANILSIKKAHDLPEGDLAERSKRMAEAKSFWREPR